MQEASCASMMPAIITLFIVNYLFFISFVIFSACSGSMREVICGNMMPAIINYLSLLINNLIFMIYYIYCLQRQHALKILFARTEAPSLEFYWQWTRPIQLLDLSTLAFKDYLRTRQWVHPHPAGLRGTHRVGRGTGTLKLLHNKCFLMSKRLDQSRQPARLRRRFLLKLLNLKNLWLLETHSLCLKSAVQMKG
jgi:hypothetical protein